MFSNNILICGGGGATGRMKMYSPWGDYQRNYSFEIRWVINSADVTPIPCENINLSKRLTCETSVSCLDYKLQDLPVISCLCGLMTYLYISLNF